MCVYIYIYIYIYIYKTKEKSWEKNDQTCGSSELGEFMQKKKTEDEI
jgi:hypothetical protein